MYRTVLGSWQRVAALAPIEQDVLLYGWATLFAAATAFFALTNDYRAWGQMAAVAYCVATLACLVAGYLSRRGALGPRIVGRVRRGAVVALLIGAVLVPLAAELSWRAEGVSGAHAQPEVSVIERAGDRAAAGHNPYLLAPKTAGIPPSSDAKSIDSTSYFPYLLGMVPFGVINALPGPRELTDARVALVLFTLLVGALALSFGGATRSRRGRALQFLIVLPTGALPLVTGGDDLPVLALLLLGLVLAQRRHPVAAGLAIGLASTLKLTAWPIAALLTLAVYDRAGRPARRQYALAVGVIALPVLLLAIGLSPHAFVENVVKFPLGLAHVRSPAQSPLLGQVLVNLFPHARREITAALLVIGVLIAMALYRRWRPRTVASVTRFCAFALLLATAIAPATRFGYLIYPANLFVWAYLLDGMVLSPDAPAEDQLASSISNNRNVSVLVGAVAPPASAGVIAGLSGTTTAPISQ